jgi:hypothetical protein
LTPSPEQDLLLPKIHQRVANSPRDWSSLTQVQSRRGYPSRRGYNFGPVRSTTKQVSVLSTLPSTMPGSTLAADTFKRDRIDMSPASDRVEPSDTAPLSIQERAHDPLPDTLSPGSAYPTVSLNGRTPECSPQSVGLREKAALSPCLCAVIRLLCIHRRFCAVTTP